MTDEIRILLDAGEYKEAIDKATSVAEEDEIFEHYFTNDPIIKLISKDKIDKISETFKEELIALGFNEIENPFISFVSHYLKDNELDLYKYNIIHNMFITGILDKNDLNGKSKDKWDHIIFNPSLYTQDNKSIEYIIKIDEWIRNNSYSLQGKITRSKIVNRPEYKNFKDTEGIINFRNDIIYKPGSINTGKFGGKPGPNSIVNKALDIKVAMEYVEAPETSSTYVDPEDKEFTTITKIPKDVRNDALTIWKDKLKAADLGITKANVKEFIAVLRKEYLE